MFHFAREGKSCCKNANEYMRSKKTKLKKKQIKYLECDYTDKEKKCFSFEALKCLLEQCRKVYKVHRVVNFKQEP